MATPNNNMSKEEWELKEKRDFAMRCYNSFSINKPELPHEEITEKVEKVIEWLFDKYGVDDEEVKPL